MGFIPTVLQYRHMFAGMLWDTGSDPETSDLLSTESAHVHFRVPRLTFEQRRFRDSRSTQEAAAALLSEALSIRQSETP